MKQVLFCGFQRKREPTLAIRKICVFGEFCVRDKKLSALSALFAWDNNHRTDVFFPHAEDAKVAKILLNNTCVREVAGYARQESAEVGGNQ